MLKTVKTGLLSAAAIGIATAAMAQASNPYEPAQTTVPVTVTVQEMIELFTDTTPVELSIVNAGENEGSNQAVSRTLTHIHNTDVDVSVAIDSNIPNNTQFHVLLDPAASWATPGASNATKTVSWRRESGSYVGATGAFPNQVSASGVGDEVLLFQAASNAPTAVGNANATKNIQYFADSRNLLATQGDMTFNVLWTIAPTN